MYPAKQGTVESEKFARVAQLVHPERDPAYGDVIEPGTIWLAREAARHLYEQRHNQYCR